MERIKLGLPDIEPPAPAPNTADSELLVELQRQNAAMMAQIGQFMQVVTQALTAPKRIVKGPDGKPIGVETVQPQQGMM
ncbi:MAG: hypothetical protein E5Y51_02400 [Mesorhizobium sp.]|nr:MAG: hypothetical protein E5Y51_02400 [Mesorhizobium sp.]